MLYNKLVKQHRSGFTDTRVRHDADAPARETKNGGKFTDCRIA